MKKFFVVFALFILFFAVSCGSSGKNENKDNTGTGETVTDEDSVSEPADRPDTDDPDTEPTDTDDSDTMPEQSDGGDSQSDDMDTAPDNSDSTPDDDADSSDTTDTSDTSDTETDTEYEPDDDEDLCNSDPCAGIVNSTGDCIVSGTSYICGCNEGYRWSGSECVTQSFPDSPSIGNICTGQKKCYTDETEISCYASESAGFFGQDAYYASLGVCLPHSFTVQTLSNQNVVLDNNTGLIWQQTIPTEKYTWENAVSYCSGLTYGGYSGDWRMPALQELLTIVDSSRYEPAIDTEYFPETPSGLSIYFWSSSATAGYSDIVWNVEFDLGGANPFGKAGSAHIRCVRGEAWPESILTSDTVNGDGIVTDSATGLMWQKNYVENKAWQEALSYCADLTYAGYTDWRLPDKNELISLVNYEKSDPASDFPDMPSTKFWSSSTNNSLDVESAWSVIFYSGSIGNGSKSSAYYVRCVR